MTVLPEPTTKTQMGWHRPEAAGAPQGVSAAFIFVNYCRSQSFVLVWSRDWGKVGAALEGKDLHEGNHSSGWLGNTLSSSN